MGSAGRMLRSVPVLLCLAAATADQWPALKTTFSINPFSGFYDQPRTADEAVAAGWELLSSCTDQFRGHRYANPADFSLVLIYDDAGYIAGSQSVVPTQYVDSSLVDLSVMPAYQLDQWYDQPAYFSTVYFVDPALICAGGRTAEQWEEQGTGDRLLVQYGPDPALSLSIPLTQSEADADPAWYDHYCFLGMGDHYLQFDYTPDQDCNTVLPLQLLYDQGVLTGFVWQHIADLPGDLWEHPDAMAIGAIIDRPPLCVMELQENPGLSTMHHYFYSYPWLTLCPLRQDRSKLAEYRRAMMNM